MMDYQQIYVYEVSKVSTTVQFTYCCAVLTKAKQRICHILIKIKNINLPI